MQYEAERCVTTSISDLVAQWYYQRLKIFYFKVLLILAFNFAPLYLVSCL